MYSTLSTFCAWAKLRGEPSISPCISPRSSPIARQEKGILRRDTSSWVYLGVNSSRITLYCNIKSLSEKYLMIFEFLLIILHILLYPYIVCAILAYSSTTPTETVFDCHEFMISDPWNSPTEEEYIKDILKNSSEDTHCSDSEPKQFNIFRKRAEDCIGHYYLAGGKTKHCIVLKQ